MLRNKVVSLFLRRYIIISSEQSIFSRQFLVNRGRELAGWKSNCLPPRYNKD